MSGRGPKRGLLVAVLVAAGIPAWVALDSDHCPALTLVPVADPSMDVGMLESYSSFIAKVVKGAAASIVVSDWEPWLQAYGVATIGAVGLVPLFVAVSVFEVARSTALTAASVLAAVGVIVSIVYALRIQGYANQHNLESSGTVDVGRCAAPTLFAGALLTQLALLFGIRYAA
jgi:hypothetical protein